MKKHFLVLGAFVMLLAAACSKDELPPERKAPLVAVRTTGPADADLPFASDSELLAVDAEEGAVPTALSRRAALVEMDDFREVLLKEDSRGDFRLAERPVIVRGEDGQTMFYEFIVYNGDGKPTATITNFAKKVAGDFTAFVLPYARDYNVANALTVGEGHIYAVAAEGLNAVRTRGAANAEVEDFWAKAQSWNEGLADASDAEVVAQTRKGEVRTRYTKWYTIPEFDRDDLQRTHFDAACGAGALAWVYRGYHSYYKDEYIPIYGDATSESDPYHLEYFRGETLAYYNGGRKCPLIEYLNGYLNGFLGFFKGEAMSPSDFAEAAYEIMPEYTIAFGSGAKNARAYIRDGSPTVLIIRSGLSLHYLVGFGTKDKYGWFGFHYDSWLKVTDNGATIGKHGYRPYYYNTHFFNFANSIYVTGSFVPR